MTRARLAELVFVVAAATFALRFVPMALLRNRLRNERLVAFIGVLPYAILAAMTVPAVFSSGGGAVPSAVGFAVALALSLAGRSLPTVAAAAAASAVALSALLD